jgi:hypothetical protein
LKLAAGSWPGLNGVDREELMRFHIACALLVAAAMPATIPSATAASLPPMVRAEAAVIAVQQKQYRPARDCTPTNGPYGYYGNLWCQPANEASYLRNLGASWPMNTPPSLKRRKPANGTADW